MLRDLFLSVPFIIKNHQRSKSNYRQCVNVSHQRTVDLVNEWGLLKMSRCKRNNMGKHSFLVLNIWLMSYMWLHMAHELPIGPVWPPGWLNKM